MKTAATISAAELRKLRREFAPPRSLAESLLLRGVEAELAGRESEDAEELIEEMQDEIADLERMRDEACAHAAESEEALIDLRREKGGGSLANRVEALVG